MSLRPALLVPCTALVAGAIAAATAAPPAAPVNPLRVSLVAKGAGDPGTVEVRITNTSRHVVRVPRYELPGGPDAADLFNVSRDGERVRYEGRLAKRGLPQAADFALLRPGETYRTLVDLSADYDLTTPGQYTVTFIAPLQHASTSAGNMLRRANGLPMVAASAPVRFWVSGAAPTEAKAGGKRPGGGGGGGNTVVNGVSYASCSSTQIAQAGDAVASARGYSENARGYLRGGTVGPRYSSWFGAYTSQRYSTASQHFVAIDDAIDQSAGQVTINCSCNQSYYAYVYPTRPYEIFVCRAFWNAPLTGTDSKAGTLIHEMSHFNVVAGTDDVVYGQSGARNLASSDPAGALNNADNHEYFAENNPKQN